ncbi:serine O-acetyltransferase [Inquilinus limosus]|uniref:serine O-acetyltransferase n=1 Tax=Inquilinus limosus TaxID=171674 RepID=UPI0009DF0D60|nr:serine O-acetyltransferase [Inquilinus limosus]
MPDTALARKADAAGSFAFDRNAEVFALMRDSAAILARQEAILAPVVERIVLGAADFSDALARLLATKLECDTACHDRLLALAAEAMRADPTIAGHAVLDLDAIKDRDPAARDHLTPFLFFKGFHALQWHRIGHWLYGEGRAALAHFLQSRVSESLAVDIHPAARIGWGLLIDHGTGVVIGETAVVGNDVSILHGVTLGGTGKVGGDRHPKVRDGVLIGAGAKILGNIEIGEGAKIGAGSVVLADVPPHRTAVGVPARIVGSCSEPLPALTMDHSIPVPPGIDFVI